MKNKYNQLLDYKFKNSIEIFESDIISNNLQIDNVEIQHCKNFEYFLYNGQCLQKCIYNDDQTLFKIINRYYKYIYTYNNDKNIKNIDIYSNYNNDFSDISKLDAFAYRYIVKYDNDNKVMCILDILGNINIYNYINDNDINHISFCGTDDVVESIIIDPEHYNKYIDIFSNYVNISTYKFNNKSNIINIIHKDGTVNKCGKFDRNNNLICRYTDSGDIISYRYIDNKLVQKCSNNFIISYIYNTNGILVNILIK